MSTKNEAWEAIYTQVARLANGLENSTYNDDMQCAMLRDLAVAFRLAAGGSQPGSSVVDRSS